MGSERRAPVDKAKIDLLKKFDVGGFKIEVELRGARKLLKSAAALLILL